MSYKILIPQDISAAGKNYLIDKGFQLKVGCPTDIESLKREVFDCDALLVRYASYPAEVLENGKHLKVVARHGVGVDKIDVKRAEELGIWVVNAPFANSNAVAEHAISFIIASSKNTIKFDSATRRGDWDIRNRELGFELEGKTLGIIGLGRIGSRVAKKAALGLDMNIISFSPSKSAENTNDWITLVDSLEEIYEKSDYISLHVPVTNETIGMIDEKAFSKMKNTAVFINCARGDLIDEQALYKALLNKTIRGAAVDLLCEEPVSKDNPLLRLDNILISPHVAAHTEQALDNMGLDAARGIWEVLNGKKPTWAVNNPRKPRQINAY